MIQEEREYTLKLDYSEVYALCDFYDKKKWHWWNHLYEHQNDINHVNECLYWVNYYQAEVSRVDVANGGYTPKGWKPFPTDFETVEEVKEYFKKCEFISN